MNYNFKLKRNIICLKIQLCFVFSILICRTERVIYRRCEVSSKFAFACLTRISQYYVQGYKDKKL